jgi:MFS family permease
MEEGIIVAIIAIISTVLLPVIFISIIGSQYLKQRNAERMAMIEKGIIPEETEKPEKKVNRYAALRNGLLMVGIALGVVLGAMLGPIAVIGKWTMIFVMALLFGGLSFVFYFFLSRSMEEKERMKDREQGFN